LDARIGQRLGRECRHSGIILGCLKNDQQHLSLLLGHFAGRLIIGVPLWQCRGGGRRVQIGRERRRTARELQPQQGQGQTGNYR